MDATGPRNEPSAPVVARWLLGLRWAVFALFAVSLPLVEPLLGFHVRWCVAVPALVALTIAALAGTKLRSAHPLGRVAAIGAAIDVVGIGILLAATGGSANPLSALLFVHVALAASLLPAAAALALAGLATATFGALFLLPSGGCCGNHPAGDGFSAHLVGMWLSFSVAATLVAVFLTRVRRALEARDRENAWLRRKAEEGERFAALATLAAGTAHELATPLATIAVLAGDLEGKAAAEVSAQVARCRDVLTRMQAGASTRPAQAPLGPSVHAAVARWRAAHPGAEVDVVDALAGDVPVALAADDLEAALCSILDNALAASDAPESPIGVRLERDGRGAAVHVEDAGAGVPEPLRQRLGEPFLTTKDPGEGMGLGLYVVRTFLERAGGKLEIEPRAPRGTRVSLRFASQA